MRKYYEDQATILGPQAKCGKGWHIVKEQRNSKGMEGEREINNWGAIEHLAYRVSTVLRYHVDKTDLDSLCYIDCAKMYKFNIIEEELLFGIDQLKGARRFRVDIKGEEGDQVLLIKELEKKEWSWRVGRIWESQKYGRGERNGWWCGK